jgi:UDP-N-acetyl-D-mannosaminuronate dehydrogenase
MYEVRRQELITEMLCRLSSKGIDAENLTEAAHKHPTNIMICFKPKAGIPMLG